MKALLLSILLLTSSYTTSATEYGIEYSKSLTQMEWKGVSHAKYDFSLKQLGFVTYFDSGLGIRLAYGRARETLPQQGAALPNLAIELKTAVDLEFLYRHTLYGTTSAYWGIGYYWDNLPITDVVHGYFKDDWDNGWGWTIGIEHKMYDTLTASLNIKRRSIIDASWRHNGALGSTHNAITLGIRYTF